MSFLSSLFLAFSMFSKIPAPRVEWKSENMRYIMCFFPFVGFFIGGFEFFLCTLTKTGLFQKLSGFEIPLTLTLLPVLITGGIHLDGFMDTSDALASHAPRERKLEILKDSRVGAFAVINVVIYFLIYFVISSHFTAIIKDSAIPEKLALCLASVFPVSRFLSSLAVASFRCAKGSGLAKTFQDSSSKRFTRIWCVTFLLAIYSLIIWKAHFFGILILISSLLSFAYYFLMSKKEFGGITGDLAGYFVQICEIFCLIALTVALALS